MPKEALKIVRFNNDFIACKNFYSTRFRSFRAFFNDKHPLFNSFVVKQQRINAHPSIIKIVGKTQDTITIQLINITHSTKQIKINNDIIDVKFVGYDGFFKPQYVPKALCIIEMSIQEYNNMIIDISNNENEIQKLGGIANIEKIKKQISLDWETNIIYDYKNYLKKSEEILYKKIERFELHRHQTLEDFDLKKDDE